MSNKNPKPSREKISPQKDNGKDTKPPAIAKAFRVRYPAVWLAVAALLVYAPSLSFRLTDYDDGIFINTFQDYNEDLRNLFVSFGRGVFDAVRDTYYRPIFSDVMILNYQLADHGHNIAMYHAVNILFHIVAVVLLYKLLTRLKIKELHAFILTLFFAVHPVLSMAVAWIPGRNDTMLAVSVFSYLIFTIDYSVTGKLRPLLLSALFLLIAYFTKETAVAAVPVAFILVTFVMRHNWKERRNLIQYGVWIACFAVWFAVRSVASIQSGRLSPVQMVHDFIHKIPLISQYIGKICFPFNLSVFPIMADTVNYYGIIALALLGLCLYLNTKREMSVAFSGIGIFLLFLLPALIVPESINKQTFEHRLYLPMLGILILLSQTVLFKNKLSDARLFIMGIAICAALAVFNFNYVQNYSGPNAFWSQAVESSPHSAYANMMLAARTDDAAESKKLFLKAYSLDPKQVYMNFIYGVMLQNKDSILASEKYLLDEKANSGYYECDYYLARVALEKKDYNSAIAYLQSFLKKAPGNKTANDNLLLLFLDTDQNDKAKAQAIHMKKYGLELPESVVKAFNL